PPHARPLCRPHASVSTPPARGAGAGSPARSDRCAAAGHQGQRGSRRAPLGRAPGISGIPPRRLHLGTSPSPGIGPPDSVCFPQEGQRKRANRKELAVLPMIAILVLALILFGVGFAVHVLWWIALIVLALWLLGFLFRSAEGAGSRRRWYRW